MNLERTLTDKAILEELGARLARLRIDTGMTQAELAEQAGISKRTLERVEAGHTAQMKTMIRILRVLDLIEGLDRLVPESGPRPMDVLKRRGKVRRRATSRRGSKGGNTWTWGDES